MALIFTFYVFTFIIDLLPAVRMKKQSALVPQLEMGDNSADPYSMNGQEQPAGNGTYGYGSTSPMNGTHESMTNGQDHSTGTATTVKPAPARNF